MRFSGQSFSDATPQPYRGNQNKNYRVLSLSSFFRNESDDEKYHIKVK